MDTKSFSSVWGAFHLFRGIGEERVRTKFLLPTLYINLPEAGCVHKATGSPVAHRTMMLFPSEEAFERFYPSLEFTDYALSFSQKTILSCSEEFSLAEQQIKNSLTRFALVNKSRWLEELVHRLKFEFLVCQKFDSKATQFLFVEILKEVFFQTQGNQKLFKEEANLLPEDMVVKRSIQYIEDNLANEISLSDLSRHASVSPSTIARRFKRHMGLTTAQFIREKRLERAYFFLASGVHSVLDVSLLVGYQDFSSFSAAFRKRFGVTPRIIRDQNCGQVELGNNK